MSDVFDPYHQWLGIPPAEQPPNHYRLLGVSLFEPNLDVIANAAEQRILHVRTFQIGKHSDESQRILKEVFVARVCLLNADKKAEYDALLKAAMAAPPVVVPPPSACPAEPPIASVEAASVTAGTVSGQNFARGRATRGRTKKSPPVELMKIAIGGIGGLVIAYCLLLFVFQIDILNSLSSQKSAPSRETAKQLAEPQTRSAETETKSKTRKEAAGDRPTPSKPASVRDAAPTTQQAEPKAHASSAQSPSVNAAVDLTKQGSDEAAGAFDPSASRVTSKTTESSAAESAPSTEPVIASPKTATAPPNPRVTETLEGAEERLKTDAAKASSVAEHQAVAQETLAMAYRAILDSKAETSKRLATLALTAAREAKSAELKREATLLLIELDQPISDAMMETARQQLGKTESPREPLDTDLKFSTSQAAPSPAPAVLEEKPVLPNEDLTAQGSTAPVITDIAPRQGSPGDLVTLQGRGFRGTQRVFFTVSGQQTFDRCAKFRVVSDNELRVEVPPAVDDRASARIIVVTRQGVTVTFPPNPLVIEKPTDGKGWKPMASHRDFLLIRRGGVVAYRPDDMTVFLADGGTLECAGGRLCHFVQRGGTLLNVLSGSVVYREPSARVGDRDGARVIEVPSVSLSSVPALFQFILPPIAGVPPSKGPPAIRDIWPWEGINGQVVTLKGSGFVNTNVVFAAIRGRSVPASFRVVSDGELHVEIPASPLDSYGVVYLFVVTPRGATATVPTPDEQAQPAQYRPLIDKMDKAVRAGEGSGLLTVPSLTFVEQDGVVSSTRGVVLLKRGATLGRLDTSDKPPVVFEPGAVIMDSKRESYQALFEVPMIDLSPVPRMYKNKGAKYHHLTEQTWPVIDWISATERGCYEELPPLFTTRLRQRHTEKGWGKVGTRQREMLEQTFEVSTLRDVDWADDGDFLYTGSDSSGLVLVSKPGGPQFKVHVIYEDGEWKIDDEFDEVSEPKKDR